MAAACRLAAKRKAAYHNGFFSSTLVLSMQFDRPFDVIVVGAGHAGVEAALASARMGADTLLLTHSLESIGQMSCNPAIGGIGKSHLVREIDALGGAMAHAADLAGIQFRVLNRSKGPAVRATRAQADRAVYRQVVRRLVEGQPGLSLFQQSVDDLIVEDGHCCGVVTQMGLSFRARAVVLTTGTFLGGVIHIGEQHYGGGRAGDAPAVALARRLRELDLPAGRLKTGTPPRLDGRSIDYSALNEQAGDTPTPVFSFLGKAAEHPRQVSCHITYTTAQTHDVIRTNLHRSPMYSGAIEGIGPRYCPSIEDKVVRFADKQAHQIFIEPEGLDTHEVYPNGISTSLPFDVQLAFVRAIPGFERVHITRPGYAIEYDYIDPRALNPWLETQAIGDLFFAGQINGTTGYEEAAAQGLLAGLNAGLRARGEAPWWPRRDEAYIGVLVDDLTARGTAEPYRMFTSRAEYRLWLREDNADQRLTETGRRLGLVSDARWARYSAKREAMARETVRLGGILLRPQQLDDDNNALLGGPLGRETTALELLRRPGISYAKLHQLPGTGQADGDTEATTQLEIDLKYDGYLARQRTEVERQQRQEHAVLASDLDYAAIRGLSHEVQQKLAAARPVTVGQASRVPGVTPAAISLLLVHLKRRGAASTHAA